VLAVRVIAADASTSADEAQLSDSIFGTGQDVYNLKSHYASCSYGLMDIVPATAADFSNSNLLINGGVTTVTIADTVAGADNGPIRNAVTDALSANNFVFGSSTHKVMYCLPPGTNGGWIGYAYINSKISGKPNSESATLAALLPVVLHLTRSLLVPLLLLQYTTTSGAHTFLSRCMNLVRSM
jgi:hypothetical protein